MRGVRLGLRSLAWPEPRPPGALPKPPTWFTDCLPPNPIQCCCETQSQYLATEIKVPGRRNLCNRWEDEHSSFISWGMVFKCRGCEAQPGTHEPCMATASAQSPRLVARWPAPRRSQLILLAGCPKPHGSNQTLLRVCVCACACMCVCMCACVHAYVHACVVCACT